MGFNSFGGDFSAGIHDFLKERREAQRLAMLDALKQKEVESSIKTQEENAATNRMYRDAWAQEHQQNALMDYIKNSGLTADSDLSPEQIADLERLGGKGLVYEAEPLTPNVDTNISGTFTQDVDPATRQIVAEESATQ